MSLLLLGGVSIVRFLRFLGNAPEVLGVGDNESGQILRLRKVQLCRSHLGEASDSGRNVRPNSDEIMCSHAGESSRSARPLATLRCKVPLPYSVRI
jgi:hypothetical protein